MNKKIHIGYRISNEEREAINKVFEKKKNLFIVTFEYRDIADVKEISKKDSIVLKRDTEYDFDVDFFHYKEIEGYELFGIYTNDETKGRINSDIYIVVFYIKDKKEE